MSREFLEGNGGVTQISEQLQTVNENRNNTG